MHVLPGTNLMRGRDTEWDLVRRLLDGTRRGKGGLLLLEGDPGLGKSLLLSAAADAASADGFVLVTSAGEEPSRLMPLAPLLGSHAGLDGTAGRRRWPAGNARARLEELASCGPVLVSLDDLQWADPAAVRALRTLPGLLAPYPISWVLARRTQGVSPESELLFAALEHEGASRARLRPLVTEAQVAVMTDVLGAVPDAGLIERAACADGNPFVLTEFLRGLVDENGIRTTDGHASLISCRVPRRFQSALQNRLTRLASLTRQMLQTGAVLGRSFRLEDVAEMLRESPGSLLASVEEALAARVVITTPDAITFTHELVWQVITDAVPQAVRQALDRQAGEMLLSRQGSAVPAAHHLLAAAHDGDPLILAGLDRATAQVLRSSPQAAAELATRALELAPAAGPEKLAHTVTAVRVLTAAGWSEKATRLAQSALAGPIEAQASAPLRCALASLHAISGCPAEALAEARNIIADPVLPPGVRNDANIALLQALTGLRDNQQARQVARAILTGPPGQRGEVAVAALLALSLVTWDAGEASEALDLAAEAVRRETSWPPRGHGFHPDLFLASKLIDIHRLTEAEAIMNSIDRMIAPAPISWCTASPGILRARIALAAGQLDQAAAEAGWALAHTGAIGVGLHSSIIRSTLATVALRQGNLRTAAQQIQHLPSPVSHFMSAYEAARNSLAAAQVEEAHSGPSAAMNRLAGLYDDIGKHHYLLMSDPASAPWLVRAALAASEPERATTVTAAIIAIQQRNPVVPIYRACAEHAQGLLESDRACLTQAVARHEDPWTRASAAEDLGVLLAGAEGRDDAVGYLDAAVQGYGGAGADRDAGRIRRRLRRLGVRRRHAAAARRPLTGWDSLTDAERSTSELVARGLTNKQVAAELFISVHTVAFHLRQVFGKLGIRSRVELPRAARERSGDGGQPR